MNAKYIIPDKPGIDRIRSLQVIKMIRKTLLLTVVVLLTGILAACGAAATPVPGAELSTETSSNPSVSLATIVIVLLVSIALGAIFFYTVPGRQRTGTGTATNRDSKNPGTDHATQDQAQPLPGEPAVAKKKSTPTAITDQAQPLPAKPTTAKKKSSPRVASRSHIFVSYRRSDSADIAGRIYDRLTGTFGRGPIFKDVDSIPLGLDFKEYLDAKVSECSVLLAIIGDRWLDASDETGNLRLTDPTDFVRIEIESALARGIPVIPLLVRGARMPAEDKLPASLSKLIYRNGIPIRPDPDFHRDMDRLIAALEKYVQ